MTHLDLIVPESALTALRRSPSEFAGALKLAAAIHWYQRGVLFQERAAELAGIKRRDFILALARANPGAVAFMDDLAARRCAQALGIALPGTVGLVLLALVEEALSLVGEG